MKKKIATRNFIFITVLLVIALVFTIFKMPIAFSDYYFNGFARSYNLGLDFGEGVSAMFDVKKSSYYGGDESTMLEDTQKYVQSLVSKEYVDGKVEIVGSQLKITVPDTTISYDVLVSAFEIKADSGEDAKTYVNGSHIKSAEYMLNGTNHCIYVKFNKAGKKAFAECTKAAAEGGQSIYLYLNEDYENGTSIEITEAIEDGYFLMTSSTKSGATAYAKQIDHSRFGVSLVVDGDLQTVKSGFSTYQKVAIVIGCLMLLAGIITFFIIKFKALGLIMSLAFMICTVLEVIVLSLFDAFVLSLASLMAMWFATFIIALVVYNIVAQSQAEFYSGKKLPVSFKSGYKKSLKQNINIMVSLLVVSIVLLIIGKAACFTMGLGLIIGIICAAIAMFLTRGFMLMYLQINPSKGNLINFVKGENIDEVK